MSDLTKTILDAATKTLGKDVATIGGFSRDQVKRIADFAIIIEEAKLSGDLAKYPGLEEWFDEKLASLSNEFVETLDGLTQVSVEKTWNAIVKVIWDTVSKIKPLPF